MEREKKISKREESHLNGERERERVCGWWVERERDREREREMQAAVSC